MEMENRFSASPETQKPLLHRAEAHRLKIRIRPAQLPTRKQTIQLAPQRPMRSPRNRKAMLLSVFGFAPDASGSETSRTNGEWALDGRKGVIAHRGKEGGDYSYGKYFLSVWKQRQIGREEDLADVASQIMFSQLMSKTPRSTIPLRNASYGGSWKGTTVQYLLMV